MSVPSSDLQELLKKVFMPSNCSIHHDEDKAERSDATMGSVFPLAGHIFAVGSNTLLAPFKKTLQTCHTLRACRISTIQSPL